MSGWVKLHRQLLESDLWLAEPFTKAQAWVDLFGLANHEPRTTWIRGIEVKVERGQTARSELTLAKRWKWSRKKTRSFLKWLEKEHQIEQQKSNVTTLIKIVNYERYQGEDTPKGTPEDTPKEHQKNTKGYTNKNEKNEKNDKKVHKYPDGYSSKPEVSTTEKTPSCPHQKIRELYNNTLPELPACQSWNNTFEKYLKARWREDPERQSLDWWKQYFEFIRESDFLMGRSDKSGFQATFEWIIKPTNMSKILNGNYKNRNQEEESFEEYARRKGLE